MQKFRTKFDIIEAVQFKGIGDEYPDLEFDDGNWFVWKADRWDFTDNGEEPHQKRIIFSDEWIVKDWLGTHIMSDWDFKDTFVPLDSSG